MPQPKYGGTFRFAYAAAPGGFDLHQKPVYGPAYALPVFNNLVRFDPFKAASSADTVIPDLAERWEVTPDGKVWTFFLRKGVKWHDGKDLTVDDVIYSIEKWMDPKRSRIDVNFATFDRVEKVDANAIKIFNKQPTAAFLLHLAGPYATIEARHTANVAMQSTDFLMGTGPFKFKSAAPGLSYEFVKNSDYFKKGLPYLDGLSMYVMNTLSAQIDALVTGRLDAIELTGGINDQEGYDKLQLLAKDSVVLEPHDGPMGPALFFNLDYTPLKDVRVRRALALLVDAPQFVISAAGDARFGSYDSALFRSNWGLPKAELDKLLGRDKPYDQRVIEAKRLMVEAGYAGGFKLKLLYPNYPIREKQAAFLSDIFKRHLDVRLELAPLEPTSYRVAAGKKDFDLLIEQMTASMGDPDETMPYLFTGNPLNFSGYSSAAVDKLWQQQTQTLAVASRRQMCQEIERLVLADLPLVPTSGLSMMTTFQKYVKYPVMVNAYASNMVQEVTWLNR